MTLTLAGAERVGVDVVVAALVAHDLGVGLVGGGVGGVGQAHGGEEEGQEMPLHGDRVTEGPTLLLLIPEKCRGSVLIDHRS